MHDAAEDRRAVHSDGNAEASGVAPEPGPATLWRATFHIEQIEPFILPPGYPLHQTTITKVNQYNHFANPASY